MFSNILYLILISLLLIIGGWVLKAFISLSQGKPINFNILNPLNLRARWPQNKQEEKK
tara:strand:+ start:137 stop:310 length:174 start_codon:yes stop_codon:yes gene_type:complete